MYFGNIRSFAPFAVIEISSIYFSKFQLIRIPNFLNAFQKTIMKNIVFEGVVENLLGRSAWKIGLHSISSNFFFNLIFLYNIIPVLSNPFKQSQV